MAVQNTDILEGIILKNDLYKNNTLLLKKGSVLNSYILNKLNNFGYYSVDELAESNLMNLDISAAKKEVVLIQKDKMKILRNKEILKYAGFEADTIAMLSDANNLKSSLLNSVGYIFIEEKQFNQDFLNEILLFKTNKRIKIFVLDCDDNKKQNSFVNTDYIDVKYLYRPLANNYIKALLRLYS